MKRKLLTAALLVFGLSGAAAEGQGTYKVFSVQQAGEVVADKAGIWALGGFFNDIQITVNLTDAIENGGSLLFVRVDSSTLNQVEITIPELPGNPLPCNRWLLQPDEHLEIVSVLIDDPIGPGKIQRWLQVRGDPFCD